MNCPHCHAEVQAAHDSRLCPECGKDLSALAAPPSGRLGLRKMNLMFWPILIGPAVITYFSAVLKVNRLAESMPIAGGVVAGLCCSVILGMRFGQTKGEWVAYLVFGTLLLSFVSFSLGVGGCCMGGYQLNLH